MLDTRMYQRIRADFEIIFSCGENSNIIEEARCVDISADGVCFISRQRLSTNKKILLKAPFYKEGMVISQERIRVDLFRAVVVFDSADLAGISKLL